ncbi:elongation factor P 5-aminopentanone reductase [Pisciglobus halotolerans]|uniref:3-oxoacyl-[acyl-carrier protein] reductase n=1 Tax=Pisciglobus halotolerans TaxID=745365 RepID=A0A1I3CSI4_9LACT|nr:SDR family oxidoreductase [Pisciglobus halotolerans]SFH77504.1 3-oxoacyl-[acyl-carrier protein] reductase [Pisciglobus halotolerans]
MKFALIMGASGAIGKEIAHELADDGWSLYLHYRSDEMSINEQIEQYAKQYPKQDFFKLHMDMANVEELPDFLNNLFQVDAIVFASGFTTFNLLTDADPKDMDNMWAVHVRTPILLVQQLQTKLALSKHGRIVFISSVYGEMGSAMEVLYSTTKGAQLAFVKAYSKEVASLGITVNAISPGAIETKMNQSFSKDDIQVLKDEIPMGRMGKTSEISFWVKQLLDERSAYLTGQSIVVSGGWLR